MYSSPRSFPLKMKYLSSVVLLRPYCVRESGLMPPEWASRLLGPFALRSASMGLGVGILMVGVLILACMGPPYRDLSASGRHSVADGEKVVHRRALLARAGQAVIG